MKMKSFPQIITTRRSVRKFLRRSVPRKVVDKLIASACWAPSAHNAQPWRFVIFEGKERQRELAGAMAEAWRKDLEKDRCPRKVIDRRIQRSVERIGDAPLLLLVCLSKEGAHPFPDPRRARLEDALVHQSMGAAVQNLLLAAHALGLGACWMAAPLFCARRVEKILNLPKGWSPAAIVVAGYPGEKPGAPSRRPLKNVVLKLR